MWAANVTATIASEIAPPAEYLASAHATAEKSKVVLKSKAYAASIRTFAIIKKGDGVRYAQAER
jgi:hypothetical protein